MISELLPKNLKKIILQSYVVVRCCKHSLSPAKKGLSWIEQILNKLHRIKKYFKDEAVIYTVYIRYTQYVREEKKGHAIHSVTKITKMHPPAIPPFYSLVADRVQGWRGCSVQ